MRLAGILASFRGVQWSDEPNQHSDFWILCFSCCVCCTRIQSFRVRLIMKSTWLLAVLYSDAIVLKRMWPERACVISETGWDGDLVESEEHVSSGQRKYGELLQLLYVCMYMYPKCMWRVRWQYDAMRRSKEFTSFCESWELYIY